MSYILDALKKAESERKLGSVPNVYMDPLPMAKSEETALSQRKAWWWSAAALLAISGIGLVWMLNSAQPEMPVAASPIVTAQSAVAAPLSKESAEESAVEAEGRRETPHANRSSTSTQPRSPSNPAVKKTPAAASPEKPVAPAKRPADESKQQSNKQQLARSDAGSNPEKRIESKKASPASSPATPPAPAAVPAPERLAADASVVALRDLPEHVRRSIPQISVGGYIYSAKPAERSMLLNNRLVREGEQVASGLMLETMMPKEAILNYQGQRFRMPYQTY